MGWREIQSWLLGPGLLLLLTGTVAVADDAEGMPSAARGYELLTTKAYLPPDFDQQVFDEAWQNWPESLRQRAAQASPEERRAMAWRRYGFTRRVGEAESSESPLPAQYVVDAAGNYTMSCLACHQGKVAGRVIPGAPNTHFALTTLTDDLRMTKVRLGRKLSRMDVGGMFMPLGTTDGTTNAVMFGVVLMAYRDADLNVYPDRLPPAMVHHDMDAPAWWHFKKKTMLYADGFAAKSHRTLMQFLLVKQNGPKKFREWEDDYRHIYAYMESLEAPKYPFAMDEPLAARGKVAFRQSCAECHGTYGEEETYPGRIVPLEEVATDPVRLRALSPQHRRQYGQSWFADYGKQETLEDPGGYIAPPLDGVWASAPYFHNGSVPTLWHLLHPEARPVVWHRDEDGYDQQQVGLQAETFDELPETITGIDQLRQYFDTRQYGKSAAGHPFVDRLSDEEKRAVLEYLKTL